MGLLSFFKRAGDQASDAPAAAQPDAVAAARTRARRRLIGASVLLGIGVIGFPLLFETQPRPIPVNIAIEIPRKDGAAPLVPPAAVRMVAAASAVVLDEPVAAPVAAAPAPAEIVERAADQGRDTPPAAATSAARPAATPAATPAAPRAAATPPVVANATVAPAAPAATPKSAPATQPSGDGNRARALLDGSSAASSAANARVVVQVGAYADPAKLGEARQKLEKLGLKTYTQVVEVEGNKRTRVRVGPFANRAEADKTAARIKAAGLPAAILTL